MREFEISNDSGDLGVVPIVAGNVEKYRANLCAWLDRGVILTTVTVAVTSLLSTAGSAALSRDQKSVTWIITSTEQEEDFTFTLTVETNDGQTLQYTADYQVTS